MIFATAPFLINQSEAQNMSGGFGQPQVFHYGLVLKK
jgi:hypothetical protein